MPYDPEEGVGEKSGLPEFWAAEVACWLHSQRKESGRAAETQS